MFLKWRKTTVGQCNKQHPHAPTLPFRKLKWGYIHMAWKGPIDSLLNLNITRIWLLHTYEFHYQSLRMRITVSECLPPKKKNINKKACQVTNSTTNLSTFFLFFTTTCMSDICRICIKENDYSIRIATCNVLILSNLHLEEKNVANWNKKNVVHNFNRDGVEV